MLLIAATTILILTAQRYFQSNPSSQRLKAAWRRQPAILRANSPNTVAAAGPATRCEIPVAGWKDILWRTYARTNDDRLLATAAGVVFFGLLAVFPAITALVSSYGLFADPSTIGANLQTLSLMLPEGSFQIVQDQIARVLTKGSAALGGTFLFGLALAVWSANAGVKAVIDALNVAYEEREKRSFVKLNLMSLAFTDGRDRRPAADGRRGGGVSAGAQSSRACPGEPVHRRPGAMAAVVRDPAVRARRSLPVRTEPARGALGMAEYRHAGRGACSGSRAPRHCPGICRTSRNYNATYGSLGAAIGLMMWMWMSAIIVLCGAELNSEIEHQTAVDTTVGRPKPLGARGAVMADSLGPAVPPPPKNTSPPNQH